MPQVAAAPPRAAAPASIAAVPGQLVVGFEEGVSADRRRALRRALGLRRIRPLSAGARADLVAVPERAAAELAARGRRLERERAVAYAEPNWAVRLDRLPSDYFFATRQWGLWNTGSFLVGNPGTAVQSTPGADIDAPRAWDMTTGTPSALIGVVDSGVYRGHWDLDGQIWVNPGERPNGADDDFNGKVDDIHGWDFLSDDANPDDGDGHGTHVAGVAGAEADGRGAVGVAWGARIMPVRVIDEDEAFTSSVTVADGLRYAAEQGADVVTMSFGARFESTAITMAIADHPETLFIASAGNTGANNDLSPWFPCTSRPSNILCVANSDENDAKEPNSAFGPTTVDLAAPGTMIVGPNGDPLNRAPDAYVSRTGTSLAVPHVAGIAALIKSLEPWHGPWHGRAASWPGSTGRPGSSTALRAAVAQTHAMLWRPAGTGCHPSARRCRSGRPTARACGPRASGSGSRRGATASRESPRTASCSTAVRSPPARQGPASCPRPRRSRTGFTSGSPDPPTGSATRATRTADR